MRVFAKVLIANRGEIAVRIARACRELGIRSVAVYSEADAHAPHVLRADEAILLGPAQSQQSYLDIGKVIAAAKDSGAEAIHPGYGFLAENAGFARAVVDAGLIFIGPTPEVVAGMGDKTNARRLAAASGVPVVPAEEDPPHDIDGLTKSAGVIGYPLLIKAAAGGGGKGMRVVRSPAELAAAFESAGREAKNAFGDGRLFLERYIDRPRHVEVQVLADHHGNVVHLGERECSIQRRHQKIVEETPSPAVDEDLRRRMTDAACAVSRRVGYRGAGTVEFLLGPDCQFYFLEMNTRLQVEHPITELVSGIDLVQAQLRVAAGEPLWFRQNEIDARGHAIECRICAEDPAQQFLPSPGPILRLREPHGPGIRVDSGIAEGYEVPIHYDPMLAKISVWGETRDAARRRMLGALTEYVILGCTTAIPFLLDVLEHPAFIKGDTHTHFIDEHLRGWKAREDHQIVALVAAALDAARPQRGVVSSATAAAPAAQTTPWASLGSWRLGNG
ncbi:MAG: acetyl-CoA carboxylase biotin carboxylase subunit [Deltaproteobacteria bacterium]|nr:acetyl-CoA carboxylase biotin carboxylase subunit [Deltaproteobacteria bacterium]